MSTTSSVKSNSSIDSPIILCSACLCRSAISLRSRLQFMWRGGWCACPKLNLGLSFPFLLYSLFLNFDIGLDSSRAQSVIGHTVSIRVRREGYVSGLHSFTVLVLLARAYRYTRMFGSYPSACCPADGRLMVIVPRACGCSPSA